ncbi:MULTISPECIES: hypothetical protein [Streptomyces]|uniref:Septum formation-related domain-containing protein n=1 Tax=Streptomyces venezuelae TaxID=54571 RepID=A0A5P2AKQ0_STRVZ|nr:hypothetical protein [Streptomyces venezuelae]QES18110.1 hypothetical protein DEJ46_02475 [Streptomyces venezuelae]
MSPSAEPRLTGPDPTERLTAPAWSRVVRLGAPRPGPAARHARWFGVPLVPLVLAALVVGGVMAVGGGEELEGPADGRAGGGPVAGPSPVVTPDDGAAVSPSPSKPGTPSKAGTPSTGAPATPDPVADTPTHTAPGRHPAPPEGSASPHSLRTATTAPATTEPSASASTAPTPTRPPARPVSFEALRVGDCFDIDRATPGTALRRDCDTPHDAELVTRLRLTGTFADDPGVREAATELCRVPLRDKAARQALGTRWTTFVQYPYRTSYLLGSDTVACSLAIPSATGRKLTGLLR